MSEWDQFALADDNQDEWSQFSALDAPVDQVALPAAVSPPQEAPRRSFADQTAGFMANVNRGSFVGDEMAAGVRAAIDMVRGRPLDLGGAMERQRQVEDAYAAEQPNMAALGRGVGMVPATLLPGAGATRAMAAGGKGIGALEGAVTAGLEAGVMGLMDRGDLQKRIADSGLASLLGVGLGGAVGAIAAPGVKAAREGIEDFTRMGVDPLMAVNGGSGSQMVGQALAGNAFLGAPLRKAAERGLQQTDDAVRRTAEQYGSATDPLLAGSALQRGVEKAGQRMKSRGSELYAPLRVIEEAENPLPVEGTRAALQAATERFKTPSMAAWLSKRTPELNAIQKALAEAPDGISYAEMKALRGEIGTMLKDPELIASGEQRVLQNVYGALTEDMLGAARALGGEKAAGQLQRADKYWAAVKTREEETLRSFFKADSPEIAYKQMLSLATTKGRADLGKLERLKRSLTADEWGETVSGVVNKMGRDGGGNFSSAKFLTEWQNMSEGGRKALFGREGQSGAASDMAALARIAAKQKEAAKFYNNSQSGNVAGTLVQGSAHGAAGTAALMGNPAPLAGLLALDGVGWGASKLLASPGFAKLMLRASEADDLTPVLRDLNAYAGRNPEIAGHVQAYRRQLLRSSAVGAASPEPEGPVSVTVGGKTYWPDGRVTEGDPW